MQALLYSVSRCCFSFFISLNIKQRGLEGVYSLVIHTITEFNFRRDLHSKEKTKFPFNQTPDSGSSSWLHYKCTYRGKLGLFFREKSSNYFTHGFNYDLMLVVLKQRG